MEHESDCNSYNGEVEDISVEKSWSDIYTSEAEITDSDSDTSVHIQTVQWVEVKNSGQLHSTKKCKQGQK
jgi:hypothetical protein